MKALERKDLYYFDVYPKVLVAGKEARITVRCFGEGRNISLLAGSSYQVVMVGWQGSVGPVYPELADESRYTVLCEKDGEITLRHTCRSEQGYTLRIYTADHRRMAEMQLYAVEQDLAGKFPLMGDLHVHTVCSDGRQKPEVVCANYRAYGYDFMTISDHGRYAPSLMARQFYADVPIGLNIVTGEEIHLSDHHIVSFGGCYSVNALVDDQPQHSEYGADWQVRAITPECPPVMTRKQFEQVIDGVQADLTVPEGLPARELALTQWITAEIRKAGGLAIYPHPCWMVGEGVFHVADRMHDWLVENRQFDAFEVLGGERYYEHNGFQTVRYYSDRARGYRYPVVGSTDSHSSLPDNPDAFICETIVFAEKNEREHLIEAIRDFRSVAVDTISTEFRLVGEERLVRYGCFLMKNYFPLHDEFCRTEGQVMHRYAVGTPEEKEEARRILTAMDRYAERNCRKYFDF